MKNLNYFLSLTSRQMTKDTVKIIIALVLLASMLWPFFMARAQTVNRYLSIGMSGADVSALQTFLAMDPTIYPQGLVTGYFGTLTRNAVINFQRRNGIDPVGRVGPVTLPVLNAQMATGMPGVGRGTSPAISNISVSPTSNNATVRWNTDRGTSAIVYYGTNPLLMTEGSPTTDVTISGNTVLAHTDLRTSHEANINNLIPNTNYYYSVYTRDGSGNVSVTWPTIFRTNN